MHLTMYAAETELNLGQLWLAFVSLTPGVAHASGAHLCRALVWRAAEVMPLQRL